MALTFDPRKPLITGGIEYGSKLTLCGRFLGPVCKPGPICARRSHPWKCLPSPPRERLPYGTLSHGQGKGREKLLGTSTTPYDLRILMNATLLTAGLACVIAGIIGGGLKGWGVEIPALQSGRRQAVLTLVGLIFIACSGAIKLPFDQQKAEQKKVDQQKAEHERAEELKAEQQKLDQQKADQLKAQQQKAEQEKADQLKAEQEKAEQLKVEQQRAEQLKVDQRKAEQRKPPPSKRDEFVKEFAFEMDRCDAGNYAACVDAAGVHDTFFQVKWSLEPTVVPLIFERLAKACNGGFADGCAYLPEVKASWSGDYRSSVRIGGTGCMRQGERARVRSSG